MALISGSQREPYRPLVGGEEVLESGRGVLGGGEQVLGDRWRWWTFVYIEMQIVKYRKYAELRTIALIRNRFLNLSVEQTCDYEI